MDTIINYMLVTVLGIALFVGPILIIALLFKTKKKAGKDHFLNKR